LEKIVQINRPGSRPSLKGPAEHFSGGVPRLDPAFEPMPPGRVAGAYVTFEPCCRSDWHTHPLGQILVVTAGCGLHQRWQGPIEEIRQGDIVVSAPQEKHWHGAGAKTAMTHLAINEALEGKVVDWLEKVTDEQYFGARRS
jgi:quercetin dioxygenase-like cupin family protein